MSTLCKYAESVGGKPGEGLHKYRILNISIFDTVLTFVGAFIIYLLFNKLFKTDINYFIYLGMLFALGILVHRLLCVRTTIDKMLFK